MYPNLPARSYVLTPSRQIDPKWIFCAGRTSYQIGLRVAPREVLVLIIKDVGLRSSLIARLSLAGESLVTLDGDPADPLLGRIAPPTAILIVDVETVGQQLRVLSESARWNGIIVLAPEAAEMAGTNQVQIIDRRRALTSITETLAQWRRVPAHQNGS